MKPDVVVVGAGLAGLSAAVRLAEAGASVRVLAKGVGSTHLGAGTIDVLGYDADGGRVDRPLEALGGLPAEHPYRLVGRAGVSAAIEWFKGRIADGPRAPYAYVGDAEQNVLLPTAVGAVAPAGVVPETMVGGDLRGGGRVCVVGFRGLKDFFPAPCPFVVLWVIHKLHCFRSAVIIRAWPKRPSVRALPCCSTWEIKSLAHNMEQS